VLRIYHLDRGYEDMVGKLKRLGARIARVDEAMRDKAKVEQALSA
jgi:UDP-N-acetylglucosamine enolpyruvyl transferase